MTISYVIGPLLVVSIVAVSYSLGYLSKVSNWFQTRHRQARFAIALINNIHVDPMTTANTTGFVVNDSETTATITYTWLNQNYCITVPYSRCHVAAMSQFKVELLCENNPPVDITQQSGIPYLTSADKLGGYAIRIINEESGRSCEYVGDIPPLYGDEVIDSE